MDLRISTTSLINSLNTVSERYPKSFESINWYSSSEHEPVDITKNRLKSGLEFRPQPSAIFVGIDEQDLLIWEINPYISSLGKDDFVCKYNFKVKEWLLCQKLSCLKSLINNLL